MCAQITVEIIQVWSDEDEVDMVRSGENVKLKLKNIEEEVSTPIVTRVIITCHVSL